MTGFFTAPTWVPNVPPIPLGTPGQVLTMVGGLPVFAAASGGGAAGTGRATYVLAAGANNNIAPVGFPGSGSSQVGRLILTAPSGAANVTGLVAGNDGQWLTVLNNDASNTVTLNNQNGGSLAANRFLYVADLVLPPGDSVVMVYDATIGAWVVT